MANADNLIPVTKRSPSEQRRISAMGGRATKGIPRYKITTCKMCKLPCPLKDEGKEKKWKCKIPDAKRLVLEAALNPEKLTESLFNDVFKLQTEAQNFKQKKDAYYAKLNLKKEVAPAVQKTENVNINVDFVKAMDKWIEDDKRV